MVTKSNYVVKGKVAPVMPEQLAQDKAKGTVDKGATVNLGWKDVHKAQSKGLVSMDVHSHGNNGVTVYRGKV